MCIGRFALLIEPCGNKIQRSCDIENLQSRARGAPVGDQVDLDRSFWRAALIAVLITGCGSLPVFLVGGLAVQIRDELELPVSQIGLLTAIFFSASAIFSALAGRIAERIGAGVAMRISGAGVAIALIGLALAPTSLVLMIFLVVGGLASALAQVGANLHLARRVDPSRQGFAFGIKQSGIPAATLMGGLAVPLIALTVGWRWAFALGAVLTLVVVALIPGAGLRSKRGEKRQVDRRNVPGLVVLALAGALGSGAANAMGSYLVDSSVSAGLGEAAAGLLFAAGSIAGLSMRVGAGWYADHRIGGRLLWVTGLFLLGSVGMLLQATRQPQLLVPATLLCFAGGWGWPGLFNLMVVIRNREAPAAATGLTQTGVYLGGTSGPLVFGYVAEHVGYSAAWLGAACAGLLASIAVTFARRMMVSVKPRG
ncbi:MAG: CynX/NimT family MFS transporter [Actinomycetota bacterium]